MPFIHKIKVIILPRQARDKHRENSQKSGVSLGGTITECGTEVRRERASSFFFLLPEFFVALYLISGTLCRSPSAQGIDKTIDPGSTVADLPTDETIIGWATEKLTITGHSF